MTYCEQCAAKARLERQRALDYERLAKGADDSQTEREYSTAAQRAAQRAATQAAYWEQRAEPPFEGC